MADAHKHMTVEVAYALPDKAAMLSLRLNAETTVRQVIEQSGLLQQFPEIDLAVNKTGIFSKPVSLDTYVKDGDRVEIYRPLQVDPKEARRRRAEKRQDKNG